MDSSEASFSPFHSSITLSFHFVFPHLKPNPFRPANTTQSTTQITPQTPSNNHQTTLQKRPPNTIPKTPSPQLHTPPSKPLGPYPSTTPAARRARCPPRASPALVPSTSCRWSRRCWTSELLEASKQKSRCQERLQAAGGEELCLFLKFIGRKRRKAWILKEMAG